MYCYFIITFSEIFSFLSTIKISQFLGIFLKSRQRLGTQLLVHFIKTLTLSVLLAKYSKPV